MISQIQNCTMRNCNGLAPYESDIRKQRDDQDHFLNEATLFVASFRYASKFDPLGR